MMWWTLMHLAFLFSVTCAVSQLQQFGSFLFYRKFVRIRIMFFFVIFNRIITINITPRCECESLYHILKENISYNSHDLKLYLVFQIHTPYFYQRDAILEPFRFGANEMKEEIKTEGLWIWEESQTNNQRNADSSRSHSFFNHQIVKYLNVTQYKGDL